MDSMDIFRAFATNPTLEVEGRWVRIGGTDEKPTRIKVARTGTKKYNAVMAAMYESNKTLLDSKDTPAIAAKVDEMVIHALSTCVLLDWENANYKGDTVFSVQIAAAMLQHRDFRELVEREANKFAAYKAVQDEADAKN